MSNYYLIPKTKCYCPLHGSLFSLISIEFDFQITKLRNTLSNFSSSQLTLWHLHYLHRSVINGCLKAWYQFYLTSNDKLLNLLCTDNPCSSCIFCFRNKKCSNLSKYTFQWIIKHGISKCYSFMIEQYCCSTELLGEPKPLSRLSFSPNKASQQMALISLFSVLCQNNQMKKSSCRGLVVLHIHSLLVLHAFIFTSLSFFTAFENNQRETFLWFFFSGDLFCLQDAVIMWAYLYKKVTAIAACLSLYLCTCLSKSPTWSQYVKEDCFIFFL